MRRSPVRTRPSSRARGTRNPSGGIAVVSLGVVGTGVVLVVITGALRIVSPVLHAGDPPPVETSSAASCDEEIAPNPPSTPSISPDPPALDEATASSARTETPATVPDDDASDFSWWPDDRAALFALIERIATDRLPADIDLAELVTRLRRDGDPEISAAVGQALQQLARLRREAAPTDATELVERISDGTPGERLQAIQNLDRSRLAAAEVRSALRETILSHADPALVKAAVHQLADSRPADEGAAADDDVFLRGFLEDTGGDPSLRAVTAQALATRRSPETSDLFRSVLRDADEPVVMKRFAASALGRQATSDDVVDALRSAYRHEKDQAVLENAVDALGAHAAHPAAQGLLRDILASDPLVSHRTSALVALAQSGLSRSELDLLIASDDDPDVKETWHRLQRGLPPAPTGSP